ncbi:hypothetical protein HG530_004739 [Fusarium avenaceum]|nr:hypothetical protein HG530_004739 [Fusarium avenaceum]
MQRMRSQSSLCPTQIDLGSNALRPAGGIEEIARCQEVDEEGWQTCTFFVVSHAGQGKGLLGSAFELAATVINLLLDVVALGDCVEVLDADQASGNLSVFAVVRPSTCVNTPTPTIPAGLLHLVAYVESTDDDNTTSSAAQSRNFGLGPPAATSLVDIAVLKILAELLVVSPACSLALDTHDNGFARILIEEFIDIVEHVFEVFGTSHRNREHAVYKSKFVIVVANGDPNI